MSSGPIAIRGFKSGADFTTASDIPIYDESHTQLEISATRRVRIITLWVSTTLVGQTVTAFFGGAYLDSKAIFNYIASTAAQPSMIFFGHLGIAGMFGEAAKVVASGAGLASIGFSGLLEFKG